MPVLACPQVSQTSRSDHGLFKKAKEFNLDRPEDLFDINYYREDPYPFCEVTKDIYGSYDPTPTHNFLKVLHEHGVLLRVYTQNIDGLEIKAGLP